jgi:glycosyltransferase involved in cell wall biosynthesis
VTARRPTIVHVTTVDMSLELLLGPQLGAFVAAGYDVVGAAAPGPYVAALERRGVRFVPLAHATRSMAPGEDARALRELHAVFRRLRPALVHTHNPKPGLYGRLAARVARVPAVVNTVHGLYAAPDDRLPFRAAVYGLERLASTCSDAELVQNPEDVDVLRRLRVPSRKIHLLGNGVDLDRFDPARVDAAGVRAARREMGAIGDDDVVVGVVGRLVREKGYGEVFAAAAMLRHRSPSVRIAVIGPDDPDKADAISAAERHAATASGVRFLGARDDIERLYAGMDVYVLASHREGFPRSAMEAAAMGIPVVATDIRGCRQVVDHGVTGVLVPRSDAAALADAVAELAADRARRARLGAAARDKARRQFDQQACIDITLGVYRRLLADAGVPAPQPVAP